MFDAEKCYFHFLKIFLSLYTLHTHIIKLIPWQSNDDLRAERGEPEPQPPRGELEAPAEQLTRVGRQTDPRRNFQRFVMGQEAIGKFLSYLLIQLVNPYARPWRRLTKKCTKFMR